MATNPGLNERGGLLKKKKGQTTVWIIGPRGLNNFRCEVFNGDLAGLTKTINTFESFPTAPPKMSCLHFTSCLDYTSVTLTLKSNMSASSRHVTREYIVFCFFFLSYIAHCWLITMRSHVNPVSREQPQKLKNPLGMTEQIAFRAKMKSGIQVGQTLRTGFTDSDGSGSDLGKHDFNGNWHWRFKSIQD